MRLCASDVESGGVLTIVKVKDYLQKVAAGVEGLWLTDPTGLVLAGNRKWVGRTNPRLGRGDLIILLVLKVAVGQISVVFRGFFFVDCFLEVFRLGLREVPEEYFETMV